jgi:tetratricopeptide (TPR) repeat protein
LLLNHGEKVISRFISELRMKRPPAESLAIATGMSLSDLEKGWHKSLVEVNFGGDFLFRGARSGSIDLLKEGATRYPRYGDLQATLATEYLKAGNKEKAALHARAALRDPHSIYPQTAYSILGYAIWDKDTAAAREALQAALSYQPWSEHVMEDEFQNLSRLEDARGNRAEAARLRRQLEILKADSNPSICENRGSHI